MPVDPKTLPAPYPIKGMPDNLIGAYEETVGEGFTPPDYGEDTDLVLSAESNFIDFVQYTFPTYKADPFHISVAGELDKVVTGETEHLMLFAPPQHGKSELVSTRLPSYFLARTKDLPIALISYAASLALRNSRLAKYVFEQDQYQDIFPYMQRDTSNWRMSDWHCRNHRGYVLAAGVGGPITGHGFGLAIIDDPIQNWAMAQSDRERENVWDWWLGTFKTRMWEGGRTILMMTRWHEDDLAARILAAEGTVEEGGKWKVISYSALAEKENKSKGIPPDILGRDFEEPLAPSRYSKKFLIQQRQDIGPAVWSAEFQQHPTPHSGKMFKIGKVNLITELPEDIGIVNEDAEIQMLTIGKKVKLVRFWDMAATEEETSKSDPDYTVGTLFAVRDTGRKTMIGSPIYEYYILDVQRFRFDPEQVMEAVVDTATLDGSKVKIAMEQEGGAAGKTMIASYANALQGFSFEGIPSTGAKEIRANAFATQYNAGKVFVLRRPWNRLWLAELASFPGGAHDDQVDSASGAFNYLTLPDTKKRNKQKFVSV